MLRSIFRAAVPVATIGFLLVAAYNAQQRIQRRKPDVPTTIEAKASATLKAMSDRLANAHTMTFTSTVIDESPTLHGAELAYTVRSQVIIQRPDKLRIITTGDGPASEFYYDGKKITAFAPKENLIAIANAPTTIDEALKTAYDISGTYFPFTDVIVSDPYKDIADGLQQAFYVGQSQIVGDTTTDIVAYGNKAIFAQIWIGADDKLPRMIRAVYRNDPSRLRHQVEMSNWQLDVPVANDSFAPTNAGSATFMKFSKR